MSLLKEYLSYIIPEKRTPKVVPPEAKDLFPGIFGKYYADPELTQYMGKVVGTEWIPAKGAVTKSPRPRKSPEAPEQTPSVEKPSELPSDDMTTGTPDTTGTSEKPTPDLELPQAQPEKSKSDELVFSRQPRSVEVMGNVFSEAMDVTRGESIISVRQIINPETNEIVDVSDPEQLPLAVQILDTHIASLNEEIKAKTKRLNEKISKTERQQLRKWLGNIGEVCGLRDLLNSGAEAYLYSDSYPKNDIAIIVHYDGKETDTEVRPCIVVGVSTKTSTSKKTGRKESSSLPFVMESLEDKTIQVQLSNGQTEEFFADDAAVALYAVHNHLFASVTRKFIRRGTKFKEEREFVVSDDNLTKFDKNDLERAMKEQRAAADRGESGGQKMFAEARKLMPSDVDTAFDKNGKPYNRIVNKVLRSMGEQKTPENIAKAQRLVDSYVDKVRQEVLQGSIDVKGRGYRLIDTNNFLKSNVANLLETTNSEFIFQSDLMTVSFDSRIGYEGMTIVPGEVMKQRMTERYGEIGKLSATEQLDLSGWEVNTRGLGLSSKAGGYLGPLPRVSPPMEVLNKETDYLTAPNYLQFITEWYRRKTLKQLEEYLWR